MLNRLKRRNPSSPLVIFVLIILAMLASPVIAQDATREPDTSGPIVGVPVETVESPIATRESAPPVAVNMDSGSGDLTINQNTTPTPPVTAPDTSNSVPTPVVIVAFILIGVVFVGLLLNQQVIIKAVAPLSPPETTKAILDSMMPSLMSLFMNTVAAGIPTDIDDKGFIEAARLRGLVVTLGADGMYHTVRAPIAPTPGTSPVNLPTSGAATTHPDAG